MEANKILSSSLLDLLFEKRNKMYGAYDLRKTYNRRVAYSLLGGLSIVAFITVGTVLANSGKENSDNDWRSKEVVVQALPEEKQPEVIPPPIETPPPAQVRQEIYTTPRIVPEDQVTEPPPTQDELENAQISLIKTDGVDAGDIVTPQAIDEGKGIAEQQVKEDPNTIFIKVEVEAQFAGGDNAWKKFLERNLNGNVPVDNGAGPGVYKVVLQFVVSKDGRISDIKPLTAHGFGMETEAIRVIKKAPNWTPAIQNGKQVNAYRTQPIIFQVNGE